MYELSDTIVAVSSPTSAERAIVRLTGPETIDICRQIFSPPTPKDKSGLFTASLAIDGGLKLDAKLYLFLAPHSYTGDDVAEIHIHTNASVTETLMNSLLSKGLRMAGPGEFTARAYLNGKIDLAQAEAVNEVVISSNKFQLAACEKLLAGRLGQTIAKVRTELIDCLSLIEAGLDFSGEDIEFITRPEAVERLTQIQNELERLLSGSIRYEEVVDLPAVGIAGVPNAGKSSLLNKLLGQERSIVSSQLKTTRDVLTGLLTLTYTGCVLFDCAGLILEPENFFDELTQQAAIEAIRNSAMVIFCVDIAKSDWVEDMLIRQLIYSSCGIREAYCAEENTQYDIDRGASDKRIRNTQYAIRNTTLIPVATKSDLLFREMLANRLAELNTLFAAEFLPISVKTDTGIDLLRDTIDKKLVEFSVGMNSASVAEHVSSVALTARHKQDATLAIENIEESINELNVGNDEIAAMMLRAADQAINDIEQPITTQVDEQILERIFSRFCIGK